MLSQQDFCLITEWWSKKYIAESVSPHFFYYPASIMREKGFHVDILTRLHPERHEPFSEVNFGFNILRFPKDDILFSYNVTNQLLQHRYDIIHLHSVGFPDLACQFTSTIRNTPLVYTNHNPFFTEILKRRDLRAQALKFLIHALNVKQNIIFQAFTNFQKNLYIYLGVHEDKIRIVPHAVDPTVFDVKKDTRLFEKFDLGKRNILCVGNIEPRKGQNILIESMPKIIHEHPDTKLLLVGRIFTKYQLEYLTKLKSTINRLDLKDNVKFLIDLSKEELVQIFRLASIFAFPTQFEMSPVVLLEAMAAKIPIIATDKPYIREILQNGKAALLVERNPEVFAKGILELLDDKNLRKRLTRKGYSAVEQKYSLETVTKQLSDLYQYLLSDNPKKYNRLIRKAKKAEEQSFSRYSLTVNNKLFKIMAQ